MECSVSRQTSSKFPFFLSSLWPSQRAHQSTSTQTSPKSPLPSTLGRRDSIERPDPRIAAGEESAGQLLTLVGLENVKRQLNGVQSWVQICRRHGRDPRQEWYNIAFQGNPGTGKSTMARIYAKMLFSIGVADSATVKETSGPDLAAAGLQETEKVLQEVVDTRGVIIIDHPQVLTTDSELNRQLLNQILHAIKRRAIVVFTGDPHEIEALFRASHPIERRVCSTVTFADFTKNDLHLLLARRIQDVYHDRMQVEGGLDGQYMQAAARRLARGRTKRGFTNVYAVRDLVRQIAQRQAQCLMEQRDNGIDDVDYFFFSKEDLLGSRPADAMDRSEAWTSLQGLVGQDAVKASVREVIDTVEENYWREIRNQRRLPVRLHRIFAGPPGTGKKHTARLYVKVLADLGVLDTAQVDVLSLSSLERLNRNQDVSAIPSGKALAVDISRESDDSSDYSASYRAALDLLSADVNLAQENSCLILIGTEKAIETCVPESVKQVIQYQHRLIHFHPFTQDQLEELLHKKLEQLGVDASPDAFHAAVEILTTARMRKDFDNIRSIDRLLLIANHNYESRRAKAAPAGATLDRVLELEDFEADVVGGSGALAFRDELRQAIVPDDIISVLKRYHNEMKAAWLQGRDPSKRVPCALVFKGTCGTGKKTVAHQIGSLYYKMGVLDNETVVVCSVTDLISIHPGRSSLQTRAHLDESRGKVLYIEDAHRFGESDSTIQAMDELVYLLPKYSHHTVVILAGPSAEMDQLLANRPRLSSLFQEEVIFRNPTPRECLRLLDRHLEEQISSPRPFLTDTRVPSHREFTRAVQVLSMFPCWANSRDIQLLARWMVSASLKNVSLDEGTLPELELSEEQAMACMIRLFNLKRDRLRYNQDPKARTLPRILSQPRTFTEKSGVKFPV